MPIAFLLPNLNPGGAERVVSLLANEISSTNEVYILTMKNDKPFYKLKDSVKIISLGKKSTKSNLIKIISNLKLIFKIFKLINSLKIDHLICFMPTANVLGIIAGKFFTSIKVTISERSNPLYYDLGIWDYFRKNLYKFSDRLVVQTEPIKFFFKDYIDIDKIKIINNPIEITNSFKTKKKKIILTVGRVDGNKNQELILRSFSKIKKDGWKLIVCGDGPLLNHLKKIAESLEISNLVEFTGVVKNIDTYYKRASIFAFSSLSEGFPNVILEAMNYDCAIISTDFPTGASNIIKNNLNGFLIPIEDQILYANQLQKLVDDYKIRSFFVKNYQEILDNFSLHKIANQWIL